MASVVPKGCVLNRVELNKKKRTAEVTFSCERTVSDQFGNESHYHRKTLRGVTSVNHQGIQVSGDAHMGFAWAPQKAHCKRQGSRLYCSMKNRR